MTKKSIVYSEGDWFLVPLITGDFAIGVIARMDSKGIVFGYFFGPKRNNIPSEEEIKNLSPSTSILITRFGDLGLLKGSWPIISQTKAWNRANWPFTSFVRVDSLSGKVKRIEYDEERIGRQINETVTTMEKVLNLPKDSIHGSKALEKVLTRLLWNN
jgi:hypothetical protein